jgi:type I restriction enzyme S subunit
VPFITIAAMNAGVLRINQATRFVSTAYFNALSPTRKPQLGDVLLSVTGSIGITALVDTNARFVFQRHIAILKPTRSKITGRFLHHRLSANDMKLQGEAVATGTAQLTIPLSGLRLLSFALPPLAEQEQIVSRIDTLFGFVAKLERRYLLAAEQVARLDSSARIQAFRGELVPQDPHEEPADLLLSRIRGEGAPHKGRGKLGRQPGPRTHQEFKLMKKRLIDVLAEAGDWVTGQEAFRACGVVDGSMTEEIEGVYGELRELVRNMRVVVEPIRDAHGRKSQYRLKLITKV